MSGDSFNAGAHAAAHTDVAILEHHWGSAYVISYRGGRFRAERRDDHAAISADSADELRDMINEDYRIRPISRDVAP